MKESTDEALVYTRRPTRAGGNVDQLRQAISGRVPGGVRVLTDLTKWDQAARPDLVNIACSEMAGPEAQAEEAAELLRTVQEHWPGLRPLLGLTADLPGVAATLLRGGAQDVFVDLHAGSLRRLRAGLDLGPLGFNPAEAARFRATARRFVDGQPIAGPPLLTREHLPRGRGEWIVLADVETPLVAAWRHAFAEIILASGGELDGVANVGTAALGPDFEHLDRLLDTAGVICYLALNDASPVNWPREELVRQLEGLGNRPRRSEFDDRRVPVFYITGSEVLPSGLPHRRTIPCGTAVALACSLWHRLPH